MAAADAEHATPGESDYTPDPRRWRILSVLILSLFMSLISVSIVNVTIPSIEQGLGATQSQLQWVLAGYALTFGVVLVSAGRAGDLFGMGPLFIIGVVLFTGASVVSGLAPDPVTLNVARLVQGVGSGFIGPQVVGMIQQYFRGAERGKAFGFLGSAVGVSVGLGPLLGGLLIEAGGPIDGWRWTFFVNVPVGILAVVFALVWLPRPLFTHNRTGADSTSRDLDPVGSILLGLAVLGILLPFVEAQNSTWSWLALPGGLALTWLWAVWERRYKRRGRSPMVDLHIFRTRSFANGTLLITLYFLGLTSVWVLVALYFQEGLGHTALETGLVTLSSAILSMVSALVGGHYVSRYGRVVVVWGICCAIVGLALCIAVVWLHSLDLISEWWLLVSLAFVGTAQGSVISPNQTLTLADVPLRYAGSSGGVMQTGQRIGTSIGIAVITGVAFATVAFSDWATAFSVGFVVIIVVVALALVVALVDLHQRRGTSITEQLSGKRN